MDAELRKKQVLRVLPERIRLLVEKEAPGLEGVQEIRMRTGKPLIIVLCGSEKIPAQGGKACLVTKEDIRQTVEYAARYSLYAYEQDIGRGFITIEGGHRVGVAGKVLLEGGKPKNIQYISSVNIRMSHEIRGCADKVFPYVTCDMSFLHTLVISAPRRGKTTLIRDMVRQISDGNDYVKGSAVGVVDERSEIGGCFMGVPQNDLGMRTDVLDCCPKAEGMMMLIRSMSPEVVAVDEIGSDKDIRGVEYALYCGCRILASVHAGSLCEMREKPGFKRLFAQKRFERYIELSKENPPGKIRAIYDGRGRVLCRNL